MNAAFPARGFLPRFGAAVLRKDPYAAKTRYDGRRKEKGLSQRKAVREKKEVSG
jgi:hypothetical protein